MSKDLLADVSDAAVRLRPPLTVSASAETGSFDDSFVEMRDGTVVWRIIRERSVLALVAAPEFDRSLWYDADLLKRLFGYHGAAPAEPGQASLETLRALMATTIQDLFSELEQLRAAVSAAFAEPSWETTRQRLNDSGRRRDAALFGRPSN